MVWLHTTPTGLESDVQHYGIFLLSEKKSFLHTNALHSQGTSTIQRKKNKSDNKNQRAKPNSSLKELYTETKPSNSLQHVNTALVIRNQKHKSATSRKPFDLWPDLSGKKKHHKPSSHEHNYSQPARRHMHVSCASVYISTHIHILMSQVLSSGTLGIRQGVSSCSLIPAIAHRQDTPRTTWPCSMRKPLCHIWVAFSVSKACRVQGNKNTRHYLKVRWELSGHTQGPDNGSKPQGSGTGAQHTSPWW